MRWWEKESSSGMKERRENKLTSASFTASSCPLEESTEVVCPTQKKTYQKQNQICVKSTFNLKLFGSRPKHKL